MNEGGQPVDDQGKPWWQSKTILGVIALLSVIVIERFGLPVERDDITEILTPLAALIAAIIAVVGRVKARQGITLRRPRADGSANPAFLIVLAFVVFVGWCAAGGFTVQRHETDQIPAGLRYDTWLRIRATEDPRPFLVRLRESLYLRLEPRISYDEKTGAIRATISRFELRGGAEW